jgi:hypothetical protein
MGDASEARALRCLQIAETALLSSRLARRRDGSKVTQVQAQKERCEGLLSRDRGISFSSLNQRGSRERLLRAERSGERSLLRGGEFAVDVLHFLLDPSDAADFDLAVLSDQEQAGDIGQAVSIRDRIAVRIVEQSGEGDAVLFQKGGGVALVVLRDADDRDLLVAVRFVQTLQVRERVLADGQETLKKAASTGPLFERGFATRTYRPLSLKTAGKEKSGALVPAGNAAISFGPPNKRSSHFIEEMPHTRS